VNSSSLGMSPSLDAVGGRELHQLEVVNQVLVVERVARMVEVRAWELPGHDHPSHSAGPHSDHSVRAVLDDLRASDLEGLRGGGADAGGVPELLRFQDVARVVYPGEVAGSRLSGSGAGLDIDVAEVIRQGYRISRSRGEVEQEGVTLELRPRWVVACGQDGGAEAEKNVKAPFHLPLTVLVRGLPAA